MRTEQNRNEIEPDATDRALLVLVRESQRAEEAAERVRLVIQALAQRRGVIQSPM